MVAPLTVLFALTLSFSSSATDPSGRLSRRNEPLTEEQQRSYKALIQSSSCAYVNFSRLRVKPIINTVSVPCGTGFKTRQL